MNTHLERIITQLNTQLQHTTPSTKPSTNIFNHPNLHIMGLFNFRIVVVMALLFAVIAFAAPTVEKRAPSLDVSSIITALNKLSQALTSALVVVNNVQQGVLKDAGVSYELASQFVAYRN
jgi:hypothetical protein